MKFRITSYGEVQILPTIFWISIFRILQSYLNDLKTYSPFESIQ